MLVNLNEVTKDGREKGYAVGAFNITGLETLMAIIQAAEEENKGVILGFAEVHEPLIPFDVIGPIMVDLAKKATVPVCVHLDHGSSIERCAQAIRMGFTSVMIDASGADYEDNVAMTTEVVRWAHSVGVTVEAELGHIFAADVGVKGGEGGADASSFAKREDAYTDPDVAKDFVERTGVDALAIAFGTAHGIYDEKPELDLARIAKIRDKVYVPLVMHGGSGLSKEEFQTAIRNGIRKINYYTYMSANGGEAVRKALAAKKPEEKVFFHDIPGIGMKAMKEEVKKAIEIFSMGK